MVRRFLCRLSLGQSKALGLLLLCLLALPAQANVNKPIRIAAGETADGQSTVNGSISVGEGATINGGLKTVNGAIRIDENARVGHVSTVNGALRIGDGVQTRDLSTVNGAIQLGEKAAVEGEVAAVNGRIEIAGESVVRNDVSNVNGGIELSGAEVGGDLSTVNGNVELWEGSVVKGDLIVEKPKGFGWGQDRQRKPRVVVGPGSRVEGKIVLEREVELFISESAEVGGVEGEMALDDAIRFSGDRP